MATLLYKDGKMIKVEAKKVQSLIKAGWSTKKDQPVPAKQSHDDEEQAIRTAAKDAGIKNWHNMGIDKLKERLQEVSDQQK